MPAPVQLPAKVDVVDENEMAADIYRHLTELAKREPVVAADYMLRLFALYHRSIEFDFEPLEEEPEE